MEQLLARIEEEENQQEQQVQLQIQTQNAMQRQERQEQPQQQEQSIQQQPSIQQQMQAQGVPNRWNTRVPNRWSTPVSVKCQTGPIGQITNTYRYFTDIQMAYIWIKDQTRRSDDSNWTLATFFETCDGMDREWQSTQLSDYVVAYSEHTSFIAEYEPAMTVESVMAINNPNAQYQHVDY